MTADNEKWVQKLYLEKSEMLYKIAARRLGNENRAEDLVQEVFLALVAKADQVRSHPNPTGWLVKALNYLVLQEADNVKRQMAHETELKYEEVADIPAPENDAPFQENLPPGLTDHEREIFLLYYEEQLSHEEIAAQLHIEAVTSRVRLARAKQHYKKLLKKNPEQM